MASAFNAGTQANIQSLLRTIAQITGKDIDLTHSASFKVELESPDGQVVNMRVTPGDQGLSTKLMGKAGSTLSIPSGGAADLDGDYGTTTLVASTKDVTVPGGVPVGSIVVATVTTAAGTPKLLVAVRKDADEITISSAGDGFGPLLNSAGVDGTLVAGEKADIALANVAGNLLAVKLKTTGGVAADHFSIVRVSDTEVKVQAHDAAGALEAGNTAVVTAYNFGTKAHETSLVRWAVIRP